MQHLIPIQITLQAASAADAKQLVQDLAGTMSGMAPSAIPSNTEVSSVTPPQPPATQPGAQPAVPTAPAQPVSTQPAAPPAPAAPTQPPAGAVPTTAPAYTLDQLGVAAGPVVDAGHSQALVEWINQRGASSLTQLNPQYYGEFATFLRSLGGRI